MDTGALQALLQLRGCDEIVDPPSDVLLPRLEHVAPPGIGVRLIGVEVSEGVHIARVDHGGELVPLLLGEAGIAGVGLGILEVNGLMGHIYITTIIHTDLNQKGRYV